MNIYSPPNSDLAEQHETKVYFFDRRDTWLLILVGIFVVWKLFDYGYLLFWAFNNASLTSILFLSINIPVYVSLVLFIFGFAVRPRLFWKLWIAIAVADEVRMLFIHFDGILDLLGDLLEYIPLYGLGALYAYRSPLIWRSG